ncbi:MAG: Ig-like domain-containing protein [Eubacterium sp.]|nr:Ig-like domain-containing protein [Eubacterium sp.]
MTKTNIVTLTASIVAIAITVVAVNPMSTNAKKVVKLNKSKLTLQTGKTSKLKLKNTKKKVKWSSKNKKVATVSRKGVVKAVSVGKTTITAKSGKKRYSCKVTVIMSDADKKIKELEDKLNKVEDKVNATPTPIREYPKVCVNLQTGVRYNYSVWRFLLWQEEKVTHHRKQQCAK